MIYSRKRKKDNIVEVTERGISSETLIFLSKAVIGI